MSTQNDIPVAQRVSEPNRSPKKQVTTHPVTRSLQAIPWWGYGLAVIAFLSPIISTRIWFVLNTNATNTNTTNTSVISNISSESNPVPEPQPLKPSATPSAIPFVATTAPSVNKSTNSDPAKAPDNNPPTLFGHYPYKEAPLNQLRAISRASDGYEIKLREAAAKSYFSMEAAAKADGIDFVVISGFRTIAEQQQLFFEISKQRNQTPAQRAKVSAPPGHSEHHTGYAMDIGDAAVPSANLSTSFEKTAAFQWLQNNAAKYGFELSFPPNNSQGVMYEPWHWRFVGDDDSLATFYKAQNSSSSFIKKP